MIINENDNLRKGDLIAKLEVISALHNKALSIKRKMNDFIPEDNYERKVIVPVFPGKYEDDEEREVLECSVGHEDEDAIEQMSDVYDDMYHPKKPPEPKIPPYKGADIENSKEKQRKLRFVSNVGLGVAIFFILGAIFGSSDTPEALPAMLIIAVLGAVAFVGGKYFGKKEKEVQDKLEAEAKAKYDREIAILNEQYKNTIKVYEDECNAYVPIRQAFLKEYADWREVYLESLAEEEKISEQLETDRLAVVERIENEEFTPVLHNLAEINDLITTEYLPAIDIIIDLLKSNRADDLKEAINLYEDIVYRERQLQLQREQEEQRRYEEEMRRQDEERRYQEEKRFREQQERQRRYEEEKREREAERRHKEEMALREQKELDRKIEERNRIERERRKQDREELSRKMDEERATFRQCNTCALTERCSMAFRRPNCASYRPR